ncbi:DUF6485 family protein [Fervidobacterium thailandense]|uniref:DUF6485 family protein n=1 Tax=Fervidobacterium thailandense TaxID=1008305 RepID=UPI0008FCD774|nr:DUF6485 family protein [Fervidobacterium thailandense]
MSQACPSLQRNLQNCTCTYTSCDKRGKCCECVAYHRRLGEIPGCFFTKEGEHTWDRSLENFIRDRTRNR